MIILVIFLLTTKCCAGPGHYECGLNGRFEYCIDDFPGCVVGCHCYPGYYFDTDTKICEPNTKLTQDYRRHLAPTSYNLHGPSGAVLPPPAPAMPNLVPPDVAPTAGDTAQDHGDLSDWLYNQFFKTIESQVVNKTDDDEPLKLGTRRSGDAGPRLENLEPFLTRRHKTRSRKKSKKRGSRKKILRDDDDSSDSSSGSDSESSSDDSGNLGSWERFEWGPGNQPPASLPKEQAAHRQIVMYSKKPKPPLPSFIFLPNMQTAFYPPIGLPAPLPMYPMVPVPPINPGVQTECSEHDETTTAAPTQGTTTPPTTTTKAAPATSSVPPPPPPPVTATTQKQALRSHNMYNLPPSLRNKIKHKPVYKPPPPMDFSMKQYDDLDYDSMFLGDNNLLLGPEMRANKMNDGSNFKYISELIHKDYNVTTPKPPQKRDPKRYEQFFRMKPTMPNGNKKRQPISPGRLDSTRRRFDPRQNGEDDSYYSSLGKQIAKLIRGLDSKGIREADIKVEPPENPKAAHPFFSESSYAARTYWERFVRSPLNVKLINFTRYDDLITGNEQLFDLENQVQDATAAPVLSWVELENVINTMGTIRNQIHARESKNNNYSNLSNSSFNVNLLPRFRERRARRNHAFQTPNIKHGDHTFNTAFVGVIRELPKSDPTQKIVNQVVLDKSKKLNDTYNNSAVRVIPGTIHINTKIHKLRSINPTQTQKPVTSNPKGKKHDVRHAKVKSSDHKYANENKPHIIIAGETTYVKSNKYFFDRGTNYQFENWSME